MKSINRSDLLIVMAVLLSIKFIFVPIYEWQQQQILDNTSKLNKLNKSNFVIANLGNLDSALDKMKIRQNALQTLFFDNTDENLFQLKQQQWLEAEFSKYDVALSNVGWQSKLPIKYWGLIQYEVKVSFTGDALNVQKLQVSLESQREWLDIVDFNYRFTKRQSDKFGSIGGYMSLRFYMRGN